MRAEQGTIKRKDGVDLVGHEGFEFYLLQVTLPLVLTLSFKL